MRYSLLYPLALCSFPFDPQKARGLEGEKLKIKILDVMSIVRGERLGCEYEPAGRNTLNPNVYEQACKASCLLTRPKTIMTLNKCFIRCSQQHSL
jgi:hypothetical protein